MMRIRSASLGLLLVALAGTTHAVPDADPCEFWRVEGVRQEVDHAAWQLLLDAWVITGPDGINRVRYQAMDAAARSQLRGYIHSLAGIDPRTLTRNAQQAYWINLYNAVTVAVVLEYPRKRSILRMGRKRLAIGPWDDEQVEIVGRRLSLNDIEHRILRPLFGDPRVHFAVNCASLSCPNLAKTAYTAANLDALLDAQVLEYLHHPRGLRVDERHVVLSSVFDWYRVDFADDEQGLRDWLAVRRPDLALAIRDTRRTLRYDYDWQLNGSE